MSSFEIVDAIKIQKILSNWNSFSYDDNTKKLLYTILKNHNNKTLIEYHYANGKKSGREYAYGLQGLKKEIRATICHEFYDDFDMVNSQPNILLWLCKKQMLNTPILKEYCDNRPNYYHLKQDIIEIIFGGNVKTIKNEKDLNFMLSFEKELDGIHKHLLSLAQNKKTITNLKKSKLDNINGRLCAVILEQHESDILQKTLMFLAEKGIPLGNIIKIFDGFMLNKGHYSLELLLEINEYIFKTLGIPVKFIKKEMIPLMIDHLSLDEKEIVKQQNKEKYAEMKKNFELTHFKIVERAMYITLDNNKYSFSNKSKIKDCYCHLPDNFINLWLNDPEIKLYKNMGLYPDPLDCPENFFNLWLPFDASLLPERVLKTDELNFFLHHIKILCNHEQVIYNYFIRWIGQMLKYPKIKTIIPTFISEQGAGKGSLFYLLKKLIGENRVFETTSPSQYCWGQFNGAMVDAYLVCLDELSKAEMTLCEGKFKGLITNKAMMINKKGIESFAIESFHRWISASNSQDPIITSKDDRRNFIIKCSNELCAKTKSNGEYWTKFYSLIEQPEVIKTLYNHFIGLDNLDTFHLEELPRTEYHNDILEMNECIELQFIKSIIEKNFDNKEINYRMSELFDLFKTFLKNNMMETFNITSAKLGIRIKNLKLPIENKHMKYGSVYIFDFEILRKHLDMVANFEDEDEVKIDKVKG